MTNEEWKKWNRRQDRIKFASDIIEGSVLGLKETILHWARMGKYLFYLSFILFYIGAFYYLNSRAEMEWYKALIWPYYLGQAIGMKIAIFHLLVK